MFGHQNFSSPAVAPEARALTIRLPHYLVFFSLEWGGGYGPSRLFHLYHTILLIHVHLNSISSQCARDKSSIAQKPKVHPKICNSKKLFKNVTLEILNLIPLS